MPLAIGKKIKEEKVNIDDAYLLYKQEAGEEVEQIELKKSFYQKQKEKLEEQADIKRKIRQEQQYSNTDKKLQRMRMECDSIKQRQAENPNYMPSKAERKLLLSLAEAERKAKLKRQDDEKKELARKAQRMKRRRNAITTVPQSVQDTIPYIADYEEGLFEISEGVFSKTIALQDINYLVAKEEEQIAMFCKYGEFINYFPEEMLLNITIINRKVSQEKQEDDVTFQMRNDALDKHRKEYNKIILRQLASGKNDIVQSKYTTITLKANNPFEAILKFHKVQGDAISNLKKIGSKAHVLSTDDRLSLLHDIFRAGHEGELRIDYEFIKKQGVSSKDYIAPASFFFDRDYFMIDDKYYRVMFLNNLPASVADNFMYRITDVDFFTITNMMIQPVEQEKGLKLIQRQVTGIESEKIDKSKKALNAGYDPRSVSHSLDQSLDESLELQDDMLNKNQKMFLTSLTVMVGGDDLAELKRNCDVIDSRAREFSCRMQWLNYQQEEGMVQSLLLGHDALMVNRTLTTESSAIFIPFTSNELFEAGGFYYGINQISRNLVLFNRSRLKSPHGFVLGASGSGKSFATKREMLNVILNMSDDEADLIVIDPDNEYLGFIMAFGSLAEVINISASSMNHINPLDLSLNYSDGDADPIILKSDYVMSLVESMMSAGKNIGTVITPNQRTIVDKALRRTYEPLVRHNFEEAYMPTLEDFQKELDWEAEHSFTEEASTVAGAVEYYTRGSMSVFAHRTNVDLTKRLIVFNTRDLGGQLKQIGLMIVLDYIWNRMVQNSNRKKLTYLYIDEVHTLFTNEFSASFLRQLYKRGRKYGLIITSITQDVEDLLENSEARKMISNSKYIMMLDQAPENLEILTGMLKLSESQQNYISNADEGCGLLFAGSVMIPFKDEFPTDSYLYKLMSTKFGEKLDDDEQEELSEKDKEELRKHFDFDETFTHGEEIVEADIEDAMDKVDISDESENAPVESEIADDSVDEYTDTASEMEALMREMDLAGNEDEELSEQDAVDSSDEIAETDVLEERDAESENTSKNDNIDVDTIIDEVFGDMETLSDEDRKKLQEKIMLKLLNM